MDLSSANAACRMDDTGVPDSNIVMPSDAKCKCNCQRLVKIFAVISGISCIVCLICLFTFLYFLFLNKNTTESNPSWDVYTKRTYSAKNLDGTLEKVSAVDDSDKIQRVIRAPNGKKDGEKDGKRHRKKDGKTENRKRRKCKCKGRRGKKGEQGPPGPKGDSAAPLKTAHYTSNFEGNEKKEFREGTKCIKLSGKTVCRNRTIIMPRNEIKGLLFPSTDTRYDFLSPASWYEEKYGPLMQQTHGNKKGLFIVQKSGIYLIYSTVSTHYYESKLIVAQTIKINGDTKFRCLDGVDFVKNQDASLNRRHKTCSVSGVTKLMKHDEIEIQNVFHDVTIDISKDRTYFGVVLLHERDEDSESDQINWGSLS